MGRYRTGPEIVDAVRWWKNGTRREDTFPVVADDWGSATPEGGEVRPYGPLDVLRNGVHGRCGQRWREHGWLETPHDWHTVCPGDWIVTGPTGERYPVTDDDFRATYEKVREAADSHHCPHCAKGCPGGMLLNTVQDGPAYHANEARTVAWPAHGACPHCAEIGRIVATLQQGFLPADGIDGGDR